MNSGTLKMTGISGLAWGVLVLLAYLGIFIFVGSVAAGSTSAGGAVIVTILNLLAALAFIVMMFYLSMIITSSIGKIACYAAMALQLIVTLMGLLKFTSSGGLALVILILLGISIILVGVFAVMQGGAGAWKAFAILLIVAGALKVIIVGEIIYPFVACAAGIVLFVAMNGAAKRSPA